MSDLKSLYQALRFQDVVTYIQSGNVIFRTKGGSDKDLAKKIEAAILKKFGFEVPVIIRTVEEMEKVLLLNPFLSDVNVDREKLYVSFLSESPDKEKLAKLQTYDYSPDRFIVAEKEVYIYCAGGYGTTKLTNNFFEGKLKVKATTRNLNTINQLLALSNTSNKE